MKLKTFSVKGFKSLKGISIIEPAQFSVFVGANAAGKSNIFDALEFLTLCNITQVQAVYKTFGTPVELNHQGETAGIEIHAKLQSSDPLFIKIVDDGNPKSIKLYETSKNFRQQLFGSNVNISSVSEPAVGDDEKKHFFNFSRIFVGHDKLVRRMIADDSMLRTDASNLELVLKRILQDESKRSEIFELLELLIPGFKSIDIVTQELSGTDALMISEHGLKKPMNKRMISDGTFNLIAIITAIYQSEKPQFLCIEEPENGLNPKVVKELVTLIRQKCKDQGHYIWLNTHSQSLVSELTTDEIILVDKVNGATEIKQVKGMDLHGLRMDEALLTNALGGGIPW